MKQATIRLNSHEIALNLSDNMSLKTLVSFLEKLGFEPYIEQKSMKQTQHGANQDD